MKLVFLGTSIAIVWYMRYHKVVKQTYNKEEDTFRHYFLVLPCFVLALLIPNKTNVIEVWSIHSLLLSFEPHFSRWKIISNLSMFDEFQNSVVLHLYQLRYLSFHIILLKLCYLQLKWVTCLEIKQI